MFFFLRNKKLIFFFFISNIFFFRLFFSYLFYLFFFCLPFFHFLGYFHSNGKHRNWRRWKERARDLGDNTHKKENYEKKNKNKSTQKKKSFGKRNKFWSCFFFFFFQRLRRGYITFFSLPQIFFFFFFFLFFLVEFRSIGNHHIRTSPEKKWHKNMKHQQLGWADKNSKTTIFFLFSHEIPRRLRATNRTARLHHFLLNCDGRGCGSFPQDGPAGIISKQHAHTKSREKEINPVEFA